MSPLSLVVKRQEAYLQAVNEIEKILSLEREVQKSPENLSRIDQAIRTIAETLISTQNTSILYGYLSCLPRIKHLTDLLLDALVESKASGNLTPLENTVYQLFSYSDLFSNLYETLPIEVFHSRAYHQNALTKVLNCFLATNQRPFFQPIIDLYCKIQIETYIKISKIINGDFFLVHKYGTKDDASYTYFIICSIKVIRGTNKMMQIRYMAFDSKTKLYHMVNQPYFAPTPIRSTGYAFAVQYFKRFFKIPIAVPCPKLDSIPAFINSHILPKTLAAISNLN